MEAFRPLRRYIVSPAPYRAAGGKRPKASTRRDPPRPMQYRRARRVETIQTRTGDTTPPARARANVDKTDNERERAAPVCLYSPAPCPYPQQSRQAESLNHTKTAARLWKAARPRPFFWRVEAFRPLRRYIVSPAPYRAAGGKRPKASTRRDPPRPMQYRRARRVETIQNEQEIPHRGGRGRTWTIQTHRQKPRPYGSAPRGGIRYAAPRGDHTPRP